jgi:hypothetical protein
LERDSGIVDGRVCFADVVFLLEMLEYLECCKTLFIRMGILHGVLIDLRALVIGRRSWRALSLHMSAVELRSDEFVRTAALVITNCFFDDESPKRL